jgi:hypothetical protein
MQKLINVYSQVITTFNLYCPRNIPFRSEAVADFLQATILDETHHLFCSLDEAYFNHLTKQKVLIEE